MHLNCFLPLLLCEDAMHIILKWHFLKINWKQNIFIVEVFPKVFKNHRNNHFSNILLKFPE